jgi:hypothetical protein
VHDGGVRISASLVFEVIPAFGRAGTRSGWGPSRSSVVT